MFLKEVSSALQGWISFNQKYSKIVKYHYNLK